MPEKSHPEAAGGGHYYVGPLRERPGLCLHVEAAYDDR